MESATIRYPDLIANIAADVPSFTLRTALSKMPLVSDRWCVEGR